MKRDRASSGDRAVRRGSRWWRPGFLLLVSLSPCLLVWSATAAVEEKGPTFLVHTTSGADERGRIRSLETDWSLRLGGDKERRLAGGEIVSLRQVGLPLPPLPANRHVLLANGDRFPVEAVRLDDERLIFRHPALAGGKETSLPLAALAVLWFASPDSEDAPERLRHRLAAGQRNQDVVLLRNGDLLEGTLQALDGKKVGIEIEKKKVEVDLAKVAAIALSTQLADALRPKGPYGRLILTGEGGRISLSSAQSDGTLLKGTTLFGAAIEVPLKQVGALDVLQGPAVYLADLKPAKYEYVPFLDETFDFASGANSLGFDLRLAGSVYDRGPGTHSFSRLTYALGGGYRRFEALVGLDDVSGRGGHARVRVLGDGKPLPLANDRELSGRGEPLTVSVDVSGVKELTLETGYGSRANHVQGCVNWVDARLIK
jgi:hypothetical protein